MCLYHTDHVSDQDSNSHLRWLSLKQPACGTQSNMAALSKKQPTKRSGTSQDDSSD